MRLSSPAAVAAALILGSFAPAFSDAPKPGHSLHGEAFDEGPRQQAVLLGGTGDIVFPITTGNEKAARFFRQGVGQLHGFWYFEAERSFRQAALLDPECAMAYWGMAMANLHNLTRAAAFIAKADALKGKATRREQLWIESLAAFRGEGRGDDKARRRAYVKALEKLSYEFPDDLEAKAFLIHQIWDNEQNGIEIASHQALDALAREVLAAAPLHPVHHYRIHLWNDEDDQRALDSAARCGPAAPGIAHMWHMPGHTYRKLKRYDDAAWHQEAAARLDHRQMLAARILPEQIHNYIHNHEWLIESLVSVGRAEEATAHARYLLSLPRLAPTARLLGRKGGYDASRSGAVAGRRKLLETLATFEMWKELAALDGAPEMASAPDASLEEIERLRALAIAHFRLGDGARGEEKLAALEAEDRRLDEERLKASDAASTKAKEEKKSSEQVTEAMAEALRRFEPRREAAERALVEARLYRALAAGNHAEARSQLKLATKLRPEQLAAIHLELGDLAEAEKAAGKAVEKNDGETAPLAVLVHTLWFAGKKEDALKAFAKLRPLAARADLAAPLFARLAPLAQEQGWPEDWRLASPPREDIGERPELSAFGPAQWEPYPAPDWTLLNRTERPISLADFRGRPVLALFHLGSGCDRCIEQLNAFAPLASQFAEAGISFVAISSDAAEALNQTVAKAKADDGFPFPIVADPTHAAFKAYRAYDDFEKTPLHGLFLLDSAGRVRWQDVSFEAFTDAAWLLTEAKRLLAKEAPAAALSQNAAAQK